MQEVRYDDIRVSYIMPGSVDTAFGGPTGKRADWKVGAEDVAQVVVEPQLVKLGRFPTLPPGEFYWFQVLGLPVVNQADGALLGHLDHIISTPGHDVYVVRQGERELLLPAVEDVIVEINLEAGMIRVLPPLGLLEAYAD